MIKLKFAVGCNVSRKILDYAFEPQFNSLTIDVYAEKFQTKFC